MMLQEYKQVEWHCKCTTRNEQMAEGAGAQWEGPDCQQQFDCYCQWMNALALRICLADRLMSLLRPTPTPVPAPAPPSSPSPSPSPSVLPQGLWQHILRSAVAVAASVAASVAIVSGECCFCGCVSLQGVFMFLPLVVCRFCATLSICLSACVCWQWIGCKQHFRFGHYVAPTPQMVGYNSPLALTFSHFAAVWASSCWLAKGLPWHYPCSFPLWFYCWWFIDVSSLSTWGSYAFNFLVQDKWRVEGSLN